MTSNFVYAIIASFVKDAALRVSIFISRRADFYEKSLLICGNFNTSPVKDSHGFKAFAKHKKQLSGSDAQLAICRCFSARGNYHKRQNKASSPLSHKGLSNTLLIGLPGTFLYYVFLYSGTAKMAVTWALALKLGGTAKISSLAYATPFISLVWTFFILEEPIKPLSLLGLAVIIIGIFIQMKDKGKNKNELQN